MSAATCRWTSWKRCPCRRPALWLERLPGVGPKTSAAVLSFSRLHRRALPVDSHHHRVAVRLGLIPASVAVGPSHALLEAQLPPDWTAQQVYDNHEVLMLHGQRCCFHHQSRLPPLRRAGPYARSGLGEFDRGARGYIACVHLNKQAVARHQSVAGGTMIAWHRQRSSQEPEDRLGMTDAQWAQWQTFTNGYGEQDENGIDISLIRENLRVSPWKRLEYLQRNVIFFKEDWMEAKYGADFQETIAVLAASGLRFVIVGGVAMRLQGSAHLTDDIDFAVARDPANLELLIKALAPYHPSLRGAPPGLPFFWDARTLKNIMNITLRTDLGSVDLLGEVAGVASFEQLWEGATVLDLEGLPVRVASIPALIAMKKAADRPKDRLHLMELEQMQAQKEAAEREAAEKEASQV